jgi:vancomycin resistance protein YoaR
MTKKFIILFAIFPAVVQAQHLWSFSKTSLENTSEPAKHNIRLAVKKMDGIVVKPDETLSINETIGEISKESGFKEETVLSGGNPVKKAGGGICQMVSTLYNAALLAGMDIVERHPHIKTVGHITPGLDATIAQEKKDLKLKNPYDFSVKINGEVTEEYVIFRITASVEKKTEIRLKLNTVNIDPPTVLAKGARQGHGEKGKLIVVRRIIIQENGKKTEAIISRDYYYPVADILDVQ